MRASKHPASKVVSGGDVKTAVSEKQSGEHGKDGVSQASGASSDVLVPILDYAEAKPNCETSIGLASSCPAGQTLAENETKAVILVAMRVSDYDGEPISSSDGETAETETVRQKGDD